MGFGASILLIAAGAVLRYGLDRSDYGSWNLHAIGVILMVVGVIGLAVSTLVWAPWRERRTAVVERAPDEVVHRY
jgi:hypothetical protein